jgi:DNA-binding transcriptional MerR regulator
MTSRLLYSCPALQMTQVDIPNRSLFRQPEVCAIASIQPYVLRSWEAEFPDLGVTKTAGGPRVYRRADVERVLRIKQLLYGEGLTLAGVRRKLTEEAPLAVADSGDLDLTQLMGEDARERILSVKRGLRELSAMLSRPAGSAISRDEFRLHGNDAVAKPKVAKAAVPVPMKKKK